MHRERPDAPGWNDTRSVELTRKDGAALIPDAWWRRMQDAAEKEGKE
jgi:hypothetical protein